jgi:hypothetical protein
MTLLMCMPSLMRGRVCRFQLLLGIGRAVFLGLRPAERMSIIFLSLIERERKDRKLGVVVRENTFGVRSRKQYLRFKSFLGSAR